MLVSIFEILEYYGFVDNGKKKKNLNIVNMKEIERLNGYYNI